MGTASRAILSAIVLGAFGASALAAPPSRKAASPAAPAVQSDKATPAVTDTKPGADSTTAAPVTPPAPAQPPSATAPPAPAAWTDEEMASERARCEVVLKGLDVVVTPTEPMREGACGSPAPYELVSIGSKPRTTFTPAPVLTCDLIVGLHKWMLGDVQPAARKHLGGPVVRIETMSSYSCRTAYGRRMARLSEHGMANALDIKNFHTDRATVADVLSDWGLTERDIAARIAAAKAAEIKKEAALAAQRKAAAATKLASDKGAADKAVLDKAPSDKVPSDKAPSDKAGPAAKGTGSAVATARPTERAPIPLGTPLPLPSRGPLPLPSIGVAGSSGSSGSSGTGFSLTAPSRLGGPKKDGTIPVADDKVRKAEFLREIHAAACQIFGTTLGPEANEAHRNHFHVDMAYRRVKKICD